MIAQFNDNFHLDVDHITATWWENGKGVIVIGGSKVTIDDRDMFKRIEDAFLWLRGIVVYDFKDANAKTYKTKLKKGG